MTVHEIRVARLEGDPDAERAIRQAESMLGQDIEGLRSSTLYYIEGDLADDKLNELGRRFADPITEEVTTETGVILPGSVSRRSDPNVAEVAYRPEMKIDQEGSLFRVAWLLGIAVDNVGIATEYHFPDTVPQEAIDSVIRGILVNEATQILREEALDTLEIVGDTPETERFDVAVMDDDALEELAGEDGMKLYLNLDEMKVVRKYFQEKGRQATDAELQTIANAWSEHCVHKTFNAKIFIDGVEHDPFFKRIKDGSEPYFKKAGVKTAFIDNAGGIIMPNGDWVATIKLETHNSPSAIEPYGGAATGSGGVFRDVFAVGRGGKAIMSLDMFGLAPPIIRQKYYDFETGTMMEAPEGVMNPLPRGVKHPEHLYRELIRGVGDYSNRMGIPTLNGSFHFDERWLAKPTVMVGAIGIQPVDSAQKGVPQPGELVVSFGGLTGRDGIGGATFSSEVMDSDTGSRHSNSVQKGAAIIEKQVQDLIIEAETLGMFKAMTDCGAAGFCSAVGEMGEDIGVDVDMKMVGVKFEGLAGWEKWVSESQERMVAAIEPEKIDEFAVLAKKHGVHHDVLGEFTKNDRLVVRHGNEVIVDLDYDFLNNGLPQREMVAKWTPPEIKTSRPAPPDSQEIWGTRLKAVLAHGDVSSKQDVVERYDTEVQGGTVVRPYGGIKRDAPNDGAVIKPLTDSNEGVVVAHGMNPKLSTLDPYHAARWAYTEAVSNFVSAGGNPEKFAVCGNYVAGKPDEQVLGAIHLAVNGVMDAVKTFEGPVISGKDSLSSTFVDKETGEKTVIPEVVTITAYGAIENVEDTMTTEIKRPGKSELVLVGKQDLEAMGGSAYYDVTAGSDPEVPKVNFDTIMDTMSSVHRGIKSGEIMAAHDVSEGGVAAAVAEMAFGGDCGVHLQMDHHEQISGDNMLFNETPGVFVVEVPRGTNTDALFEGVEHTVIGSTTTKATIKFSGNVGAFEVDVDELKVSWKSGTNFLRGEVASAA